MYIHLDTDDYSVVDAVYEEIVHSVSDGEEILETRQPVYEYQPGLGQHILSYGVDDAPVDSAESKWSALRLATVGARLWSPEEFRSPAYAGTLDENTDIGRIIVDAKYAENRAAYFASFGVNYLGRTFSDPRIIVVLDNKKDKIHHPSNSEDIRNLLLSLPQDKKVESSWEAVALVSAGNVHKLEEFLDYLSETNVAAFSKGAHSKLNFIGRDFASVDTPRPGSDYGIALRDAAGRLRPVL